jgi:hypothetical protein
MAALGKNNGPYSFDVRRSKHRNATVTSILNSPIFDKLIRDIDKTYEYEIGYVPAGYEHRPDLIANVYYGSPNNWWLLMLVNNITDPFEGFKVNERILIPKLT